MNNFQGINQHIKGFFMVIKKLSNFILMSFIIVLTGCSSTTSHHLVCDFLDGAGENSTKRHDSKGQSDIHGNVVKNKHNSDVLEGLLSVFGGMLTRAISSDKKEKQACRR